MVLNVAMSTFTPISFYLELEIQDLLDYAVIIEEINQKTTP
ncbi:hypothetical protein [uncultured Megamonas sp.]|nr:hypothetical protein [uncultured Megamonas sp.]